MSKFIMTAVLFCFVLFPILQYALNTINHNHQLSAIEITYKHAQRARQDGYFTSENINSLKQEIADKMGIPESEVQVVADQVPKYRFQTFDEAELIQYEVQVPINRILAMASYFGFSSSENQTVFRIKGEVQSEVLAP